MQVFEWSQGGRVEPEQAAVQSLHQTKTSEQNKSGLNQGKKGTKARTKTWTKQGLTEN